MNCDEYIRSLKLEEIAQTRLDLYIYVQLAKAAFEAGQRNAPWQEHPPEHLEPNEMAIDADNFDQDPR